MLKSRDDLVHSDDAGQDLGAVWGYDGLREGSWADCSAYW